jgi:hypothetical protein
MFFVFFSADLFAPRILQFFETPFGLRVSDLLDHQSRRRLRKVAKSSAEDSEEETVVSIDSAAPAKTALQLMQRKHQLAIAVTQKGNSCLTSLLFFLSFLLCLNSLFLCLVSFFLVSRPVFEQDI